jgi:hypothetical protein
VSSTGDDEGSPPVAPVEKATHRGRARSKPGAEAPNKRERVKHFIRMMRENRYVRNISIDECAEQWGLSPLTVRDDAFEAARSFEESDEERAVGKAMWLEQVKSAAANARGLERCEAEARFLELQAKASGYLEPQKVELSGSLGDLLSLATSPSGEDPEEPVEE